ncbi:very-long-chain aldehyde decarbonylase GL1-4 isoform X2 [Cryptomeria japonica]|uniref:very-long-chain aldehyde decarbonylase GL1-4 isoform X2 n=1 Tax=Cryptomeria japonica TaxID=3369 RepID=UPI0025AB64CC|nr:very-long-chain aldehyde decarbonylase GL1-4 isoform X2 [Cryptomeria japonica]
MASKPGPLTGWPWEKLGNFKYLLLSPLVIKAVHTNFLGGQEADNISLVLLLLVATQYLHNQLWISVSRYQNARSKHQIQSKSIHFEQVDRERTWYHSLHHSQVHTNFCLFMPLYDYLYGTADKSSQTLYETSRKGRKEKVDLVYLTHATSLLSFFHLRFGFASFAAKPYSTKWYMWILWPISNAIMIFLWLFGQSFIAEKNRLNDMHLQTWVIPRYTFQYSMPSERAKINKLIEDSILEAEKKEVKVISLGLLNQSEDLNGGGELFLKRHKNLKARMVDGSTLVAAVVLNSIPSKTGEVFMCGGTSKVGSAILCLLSQRGVSIQLLTESREQLDQMKSTVPSQFQQQIIPVNSYQAGKNCKIWIVGRWVSGEDQMKAPKGALFIPFQPFPIPRTRKDCFYYSTPAMRVPANLENVHTCENWLPRRVMSAWRVGGMVHALQGWNHHECGQTMNTADINKVWEAALKHGFLPFNMSLT